MAAASKKPGRAPLAAAPVPRAPGAPPRTGVPAPREGGLLGQALRRSQQPSPPPAQRPVGSVPNPRTPTLVRDADRGTRNDLFVLFPDLPRPLRPPLSARTVERLAARRPLGRRQAYPDAGERT